VPAFPMPTGAHGHICTLRSLSVLIIGEVFLLLHFRRNYHCPSLFAFLSFVTRSDFLSLEADDVVVLITNVSPELPKLIGNVLASYYRSRIRAHVFSRANGFCVAWWRITDQQIS